MELGNLLFNKGNNNQKYECPEYIVALLDYLDKEIQRVMWNNTQREFDSPFSNTGNSFKNSEFEVKAYNWNEEVQQSYNFKYRNIEISWYKYLGRDTTINKKYNYSEIIHMFNDCLNSIRALEKEEFE